MCTPLVLFSERIVVAVVGVIKLNVTITWLHSLCERYDLLYSLRPRQDHPSRMTRINNNSFAGEKKMASPHNVEVEYAAISINFVGFRRLIDKRLLFHCNSCYWWCALRKHKWHLKAGNNEIEDASRDCVDISVFAALRFDFLIPIIWIKIIKSFYGRVCNVGVRSKSSGHMYCSTYLLHSVTQNNYLIKNLIFLLLRCVFFSHKASLNNRDGCRIVYTHISD